MDTGKIKVNAWIVFVTFIRVLFSYLWSKLLQKISNLKTLCVMQRSDFKRLTPTDLCCV